MKRSLSLILLCAFWFSTLVCMADSGLMLTPQTNEVIPPAPSTAQQMRYQSPQPALATGSVNLSIPLYTIDVEGVSIPFTLNYHTSGIKPLDDPFPCGYGWSLQPALRITRTVRGRPDEHFDYWGEKISVQDLRGDRRVGFACMVSEMQHSACEVTDRYDPEKDIFTIALPSGTYTRVMNRDVTGKIAFLGGENDSEISVSSSGALDSITVTDSRGIIYVFGSEFAEQPEHAPFDVKFFTTSWGLKRIVLPSDRTIVFDWAWFFHPDKKIFGGDSSADMLNSLGQEINRKDLRSEAMHVIPSNPRGQYKKRMHLSKVTFPHGQISIAYSDTTLATFTVRNGSEQIRNIKFSYGTGTIEHRFLKEINIDGEGKYSFEYDPQRFDEFKLWHRQDWWGYYNGRRPYDGDGNICLTPRLTLQEVPIAPDNNNSEVIEPYNIGHADRRPDENAMKAGILTRMTYPTGAKTDFKYEAHRFPAAKVDSEGHISSATDPSLNMGGGLRVSRITTLSQTGDTLKDNTYSYSDVAVTAVPSASTFVTVSYATGLAVHDGMDVAFDYRHTFVGHSSNYMDCHIGEPDIWYRRVTEYSLEGKTEYEFSLTNPLSTEHREWGVNYPVSLNNVFSHGPQLTGQIVYKDSPTGGYTAVETVRYVFEKTGGNAIVNSHISRVLLQTVDDATSSPDFTDGERVQYPDLHDKPNLKTYKYINITVPNHLINEYTPYRISCYQLNLISDRLASKTVTRHLDNGDFTQTETYSYKPGTSIVTSVVTTTSGDTRTNRIDLSYPSATSTNTAERAMAAANMVGVPIKSVHTFGSATIAVTHEMANYGLRVYRPKKTTMQRGSESWTAAECSYDSYGNLREYRGQDSVRTTYLWGYSALHPVYQVIGAKFAEVSATGPGSNALGGSAELTDLTSKLSSWLTTRLQWKPLVGVTSQRSPTGLTSTYQYDSAGRLIKTAVDGHGPVSAYSYHINESGKNYTTVEAYTSSTATSPAIREVINYDGLGRETARLSAAPSLSLTPERASSLIPINTYYAVLTEYDEMDRPYRVWSPVTVGNKNPTKSEVSSAANTLYGTSYAYTTTLYDPSPAATVTGSLKAGSEWHSNNKTAKVRYLSNLLSGDYSCYQLKLNGTSLSRTLYPKNTLVIKEVTDEEGRISMTFTDLRGLTVMTREGKPGDWNDTRYIYNDYGDLLAVLQPMADISKSTIQKEWTFTYSYDSRGRCIEKSLPGCSPISYVYDNCGRLFAEQDGVMSSRGEWLVHFYDRFGRDACSSIATASKTQVTAAAKTYFTATAPTSSSSVNTTTGGYAIDKTVPLTLVGLDRALYYDSYDFGGRVSWVPSSVKASVTGAPMSRSAVRGLQTGSLSEGRISAVYYDDMCRQYVVGNGNCTGAPDHISEILYDYEGRKSSEWQTCVMPQREVAQRIDYSYFDNGALDKINVTQGSQTASAAYSYDNAGRISGITYGGSLERTMTYDVHGWLKSVNFTVPVKIQTASSSVNSVPSVIAGTSVHQETLYYADAPSGATARFDGKIAARQANGDLTGYGYDSHGRLLSSTSLSMKQIAGEIERNFSTSYTYDRNANITSLTRMGIKDVHPTGQRLFGLHNHIDMRYTGNQLNGLSLYADGADYEGRTGLGTFIYGSPMSYDANGNLTVDEPRNILRIRYNQQNQPTEVTFGEGHRQTITYDGFGRKIRVDYSQVPDGMIVGHQSIYTDDWYQLTSTREYVGPHVFCDGRLEYSAFPGGYFEPDKGAMYYITDWQGNNAAVVSKDGTVAQQTIYYPYGEPTIEPEGQRYLYGGKEREHAGGRNSYDFGARCLTPYGCWSVPDSEAESFYPYSPYCFCNGDPINHIDNDGNAPWLIAGAIGGVLDFCVQVSTNIVKGESFTEAICHVDLTSVGASAATSALLGPGAGWGAKAAAIMVNISDAAIDVHPDGKVEYVGGEDDNEKSITKAAIDFGASMLPDFGINHDPGITKGLEKEWTKEEMDNATKVVFKISSTAIKLRLDQTNDRLNKNTESTDAIKPNDKAVILERINYEKIL